MVDTGAASSSVNVLPTQAIGFCGLVSLVGFGGQPVDYQVIAPLTVKLGSQSVLHSLVYSPHCPVNLLGRDLLCCFQPLIKMTPAGLVLTLTDGTVIHCRDSTLEVGNYPMLAVEGCVSNPVSDIYWGLVDTSSQTWEPLKQTLESHMPWIRSLTPAHPPQDPLHCTLYYDRLADEVYRDQFQRTLEDNTYPITVQHLCIGAPGVCFLVSLGLPLQDWYKMDNPPPPMPACSPHITLLVDPRHTAKDLGPFARECSNAFDWQSYTLSGVEYSPSLRAYRVLTQPFQIACVMQHQTLSRSHGRETSDSDKTGDLLNSLPESLWSTGPMDAGLLRCDPVTFEHHPEPVWLPQYYIPPEAEVGIHVTIEGLCKAGVLVPTQTRSRWNTPILPVKKAPGKYRMVHDLRAVNDVTVTPTENTPNPFSALALIGPHHHCFSVIDLSNAFFCVPLDPKVSHIFAFHWRGVQLTYSRLPPRICSFSWHF